ncbi:PREDICTED: F-box/LRR-repeat At3g26922 [Prunus dulcis]|uniref:PREDICTED: F-box/LRR-repeat At3g26922 n=1 Tax=Prunus dulcis TaxID=3755 RepID=A0A5E4EDU3_PRUDU|nr:PREDICTED: F-box/LRR-repeat At3g26922 [Prunus dulcis]
MIPPSISHFTGFAQLENLNLRMSSGEMPRLPRNIAPLGNLKQVELSRPESPPGFSENERSERWQPEEFTHSQFKEVEIAGCVGREGPINGEKLRDKVPGSAKLVLL